VVRMEILLLLEYCVWIEISTFTGLNEKAHCSFFPVTSFPLLSDLQCTASINLSDMLVNSLHFWGTYS
jgi:hypothetical protein